MSQTSATRPLGDGRGDEQVVCVPWISREQFSSEYLVPRIPVIVANATSTWPALRKWTWDWLAATYGHHDVLVADPRREKRPVRFAEYLQYVLEPARFEVSDGPLYLSDLGLHELPAFLEDYSTPLFVEDWFARFPAASRPPFRWFFIGPAGTGSALHRDTSGTHAWLAQIHGEKEWRLFAPDDLPEEYCGQADAFAPDIERFPAFAEARCYSAILHPGEILFVPCGWRHQVRNLGPSWALTENFCNASNLEDVYRETTEPGMRPILEELCLLTSRERNGRVGIAAASQERLLHEFLGNRERELAERLAAIQSARKSLSPPSST